MARGNNCERVFHGKQDSELFLAVLQEAIERFGIEIFSYCMMPNHYHLAVRTPIPNLSKAMAWLQTTFTVRHRISHKRVGHLFQGRYKAQLVESGDYLKTLILYIHLNPIRTRKRGQLSYTGTYTDLDQYRWSSHPFYLGKSKPAWLNLEPLKFWGKFPKEASQEYRRVIKSLVKDEPLDWNDHIQHGLLAGSQHFVTMIKKKLSKKPMLSSESGKAELTKMNAEQRRALLRPLLQELNDERIITWARVKLQMERPADLASEKGYRDGGSILQIVKRVELRSLKDVKTRMTLQKLRKRVSIVEV